MKVKHAIPAVFVLAGTLAAPAAEAQNAPPPNAYSLTEHNSMMRPETVHMFRQGNRVAMETVVPRSGAMPRALHTRDVINLNTHKEWTWEPDNPSTQCSVSTLSGKPGDWSGNPFEWRGQIVGDVSKFHPRDLGTATIAGLATKVTGFVDPEAPAPVKIWVDTKYGLLMKMATAKPGSPDNVALEVTRFEVGNPPARVFALPPACKGK